MDILKGYLDNNIPLISQLISLVDCWDAMRSNRAYRDALSYNDSIDELKKGKNKQHNEMLVNKFITMLESQNDTLFSHK
ncbi:MAG: hypothetical protein U5K53_08190 [Halanaerobiales bacterium]|nr:hypothetical protein [Halanaerobiales bacterium]